MARKKVSVSRKTKETQVRVTLGLDGRGRAEARTGVGFLDHMLELLGKHALFDLTVRAAGDTQVDDHHTVEDVGIVLGQALDKALGDRAGVVRFGHAAVPMDEALAEAALDLSGRPHLVFNARFEQEKIGAYDVVLTREFLHALATNARLTLHVAAPYGTDGHHITEAIFKALARALAQAVARDPRVRGVPSTKGTL